MNPEIVIAMYRPNEGREEEMLALVRKHMPALRKAGLVTDRPSILCRSSNGTLLEIFEWRDHGASAKAHEDPEVGKIWGAMSGIGEFPALSSLPEAAGRFPHFTPVELP